MSVTAPRFEGAEEHGVIPLSGYDIRRINGLYGSDGGPSYYIPDHIDAGVYRALRPRGPLDTAEEIDGAAVETLVAQELRAVNDNLGLGYALHFWHTRDHREVDFVLYGERGLVAIEVKRSSSYRASDLASLRLFRSDYPMARCLLLYGGAREYDVDGLRILPLARALADLPALLDPSRRR